LKDTRSSGEIRSTSETKKIVTPYTGKGFDFIARLEKLFKVLSTYFWFWKYFLKASFIQLIFVHKSWEGEVAPPVKMCAAMASSQ